MNEKMLDRLVCPDDRSRLHFAEPQLVERLNAAIAAHTLKNRSGQPLADVLDSALVRADGAVAYPVIDGIPHMLAHEAIPLAQLEGAAP